MSFSGFLFLPGGFLLRFPCSSVFKPAPQLVMGNKSSLWFRNKSSLAALRVCSCLKEVMGRKKGNFLVPPKSHRAGNQNCFTQVFQISIIFFGCENNLYLCMNTLSRARYINLFPNSAVLQRFYVNFFLVSNSFSWLSLSGQGSSCLRAAVECCRLLL